jgi:hypothetical protein
MHRLCLMVIALLVGAAVSNAVAQPVTPGIVSSPCPPRDPAAEAGLKPIDDLFMTPAASPEVFWDSPNLCRYKAANARREGVTVGWLS